MIAKKVVVLWLQMAVKITDYLDPFQSELRPQYSTETPLVLLVDNLWKSWIGVVEPS